MTSKSEVKTPELWGFVKLRHLFNTAPKSETIAAMIMYGWSSAEAAYAFESWIAEQKRIGGGPLALDPYAEEREAYRAWRMR
jgi:hypothetical protein